MYLVLMYSEKAKKIWKNLPILFDLTYSLQKRLGVFFSNCCSFLTISELLHEPTRKRVGHCTYSHCTNQNILRFSETPCWETIGSFCDFECFEAHTKDPLHLFVELNLHWTALSVFQHTIHKMSRPSVYTLIYEKIVSQVDKIWQSRLDRATKFSILLSALFHQVWPKTKWPIDQNFSANYKPKQLVNKRFGHLVFGHHWWNAVGTCTCN